MTAISTVAERNGDQAEDHQQQKSDTRARIPALTKQRCRRAAIHLRRTHAADGAQRLSIAGTRTDAIDHTVFLCVCFVKKRIDPSGILLQQILVKARGESALFYFEDEALQFQLWDGFGLEPVVHGLGQLGSQAGGAA